MSEYQYYEFVAIDRPLTPEQREEVSKYSSRAEISSTRFVNVYNYSDFRGDPRDFLTKYYDAMVYVANWGTRRFMLRLPLELVDAKLAVACCGKENASVGKDSMILDLSLDIEDGGEWEEADGDGWMDLLAPVRSELLAGDSRLLYIVWVLRLTNGELKDKDREPFRPRGLSKLTKSLKNLVEFLKVDNDLLAVCAAGDSSEPELTGGWREFEAWFLSLPSVEKDALLIALMKGDDPHLVTKTRRRFDSEGTVAAAELPSRTVSELQTAAETAATARKEAAKAKAAAARHAKLVALDHRGQKAWDEVEQLIESKNAENYDAAVALLVELRQVAEINGTGHQFEARVAALNERHRRKATFIKKLHARIEHSA